MILTDDEIRKAAEFAAEQMWPESGYVGWTEDDAVYHRKFIEACFENLRAGVELPEPEPTSAVPVVEQLVEALDGLFSGDVVVWSLGGPARPRAAITAGQKYLKENGK